MRNKEKQGLEEAIWVYFNSWSIWDSDPSKLVDSRPLLWTVMNRRVREAIAMNIQTITVNPCAETCPGLCLCSLLALCMLWESMQPQSSYTATNCIRDMYHGFDSGNNMHRCRLDPKQTVTSINAHVCAIVKNTVLGNWIVRMHLDNCRIEFACNEETDLAQRFPLE